jgi:glutamate synthase (ferredoxin)
MKYQVNKEIVKMQRVVAPAGQQQLRRLLQAHVDKTQSKKGQLVLENWEKFLPLFWQLVPPSEEDTPEANAAFKDTIPDLVAQSA